MTKREILILLIEDIMSNKKLGCLKKLDNRAVEGYNVK